MPACFFVGHCQEKTTLISECAGWAEFTLTGVSAFMPTCIWAIKERKKNDIFVCVCVYMCISVNIEEEERGEGSAERKRSRGKQEMDEYVCAFSERLTQKEQML